MKLTALQNMIKDENRGRLGLLSSRRELLNPSDPLLRRRSKQYGALDQFDRRDTLEASSVQLPINWSIFLIIFLLFRIINTKDRPFMWKAMMFYLSQFWIVVKQQAPVSNGSMHPTDNTALYFPHPASTVHTYVCLLHVPIFIFSHMKMSWWSSRYRSSVSQWISVI